MSPETKRLQILTMAILDNAHNYEWSIQGFGLLRLYIRDVGRLHIWNSSLRYENVSTVHNHSWDLHSTIIAGKLHNTRYVHDDILGWPYHGHRLVTGFDTRHVEDLPLTKLYALPSEVYLPGDTYSQYATVIHRTDAEDGTVTLMERALDVDGQADIYWPAGTEFGTAKPRIALHGEVEQFVRSVKWE